MLGQDNPKDPTYTQQVRSTVMIFYCICKGMPSKLGETLHVLSRVEIIIVMIAMMYQPDQIKSGFATYVQRTYPRRNKYGRSNISLHEFYEAFHPSSRHIQAIGTTMKTCESVRPCRAKDLLQTPPAAGCARFECRRSSS